MIFTFTTVFYRFGGDFVSERPPRDRRYNPHSGQIKDHKCMLLLCYFLFDGVQRHFQQYFSYIVVVNFYYDLRIKLLFGSSLPPIVCRRAHVLFTLFVFVFAQRCPTHIVLWFFFFGFFVLCALCCQFLWIVHFLLPLRYSLTFYKMD